VTLLLLFGGAFLAATILPFSSEAMLAAALAAGSEPWPALLAAGSGNTLGAMAMWGLARLAYGWLEPRLGPKARRRLDRAGGWLRCWGLWALLLSWLPVIGDAIPIAAGVARSAFWPTLALVAIGKFARYAALIGLFALGVAQG